MRLNRAVFDRHTQAFERLMAAFDRHERRFNRSQEITEGLRQAADWRNDPVAEGMARETDELLRAVRTRTQIVTRRIDETLAKWEDEREESRALRRELLERIDRLPPAQAA